MLHSFTGGPDGANPATAVTMDGSGRLYGTAELGGLGHGTVFQLKPSGSGWTFAPIYQFTGGVDGGIPLSPLTVGPSGALYSGTYAGGGGECTGGCGVEFSLRPPARPCQRVSCSWDETVLHVFQQTSLDDGARGSKVVFDPQGNLYGFTAAGGPRDIGTAYELSPSNGVWTETILHVFTTADGPPYDDIVRDSAGNLYDTSGVVFELSPGGSGWTESILHQFVPYRDGSYPEGLIMDSAGNLYGGASMNGYYGSGTVYELSPSNGGWNFNVLVQVPGGIGCGVSGPLVMDASGYLYGTTTCGVGGTIFKMTPSSGGWTYTTLYNFTGGSDGRYSYGGLAIDADGKPLRHHLPGRHRLLSLRLRHGMEVHPVTAAAAFHVWVTGSGPLS